MLALRSVLALLAFVLELCLVAAYGYFGLTFPGAAGWILGLGLPAVLIVVWGALAAVGFWSWGVALFIVFILDRVLLERLGKPDWATPRA